MAGAEMTSTKPSNEESNVFNKPLALFSKSPLTGYLRDGYCRSGPSDPGNHAIAGVVTSQFLDFTASQGNDLRAQAGLKDGMKWCLCTSRWKQALDAYNAGTLKDPKAVPKVFMHASEKSALENGVSLQDLQKWAAEGEAPSQTHHRQDSTVVPGQTGGSAIREV